MAVGLDTEPMTVHAPRPAHTCQALLAALVASEGRSRARKRDQTPDAIGLGLRRELLERVIDADPAPEFFEAWLLDHVEASAAPGAVRAIARTLAEEWRLARQMDVFETWLKQGAPSADSHRDR